MKRVKFDFGEYMKNRTDNLNLIIYPDGHAEYMRSFLASPDSISIKMNCVLMYPDKVQYNRITNDQICTLRQLKSVGAYRGEIPD